MITEDQTAVIDFLASPAAHDGVAVERIDTHASVVFLAGTRAWKLKRAVRFDYLDFSTEERRHAMCEAEVRLNRRAAPAIYRGVVPVTRQGDGSLALGGGGTPVDWVIEMNRFDQAALFDRLAASGGLDLALMTPLAGAIARFHAAAERRSDHGGKAGMRWVIDGNADAFTEFTDILEESACVRLTDAARAELDRRGDQLDARRAAGFVRQCHGDLHLRNIVLLAGEPTLFDAVEFNGEIACVDVLYDLGFLLMDLRRRRLPEHANAIWNGYLGETAHFGGSGLMPLFLSCRAAVRAKTNATAARLQQDPQRARELQESAREYLDMAESLLHPPPARLIAIGGLSGTGKSTLALSVAPAFGAAPGAVVLRSDEIRKRLCGVPPLERLGAKGYAPAVSERVYQTLTAHAAAVANAGHTVVVDAVFAKPADRRGIERVAEEAGVPFVGIWLDAPQPILVDRVQRRHSDASDADATIVRMQGALDPGAITWRKVDASAPGPVVLGEVFAWVRACASRTGLASAADGHH